MIDKRLQEQIEKAQKDIVKYSASIELNSGVQRAIATAMNIERSIIELAEKKQEEAEKYASLYIKNVEDFMATKASLASTQSLLSLAESVNRDNFQSDISELSIQQPKFDPSENTLPNIRNYAQEMLESLNVQRETLIKIVSHTEEQNDILKQQISLTQESSIKQGKDNRRAIYITLIVAVVSIVVSIYSADLSVKKAEEIYQKENISTTKQNTTINQSLDTLKHNTNIKKEVQQLKEQLSVLNQNIEDIVQNSNSNTKNETKQVESQLKVLNQILVELKAKKGTK